MRRAGRTLWSRRWGYAAAGWATAFALLHFFWALGGSAGLAASAGTQLAAERPAWFVLAALWGVGGLLLVGAAVGVALARAEVGGIRRLLLTVLGAGIALVLLARGLGIEILMLAGAYDANAALGPGQERWTLLLWNPWFVAGGIAFGAAAAAFRRSAVRPAGTPATPVTSP